MSQTLDDFINAINLHTEVLTAQRGRDPNSAGVDDRFINAGEVKALVMAIKTVFPHRSDITSIIFLLGKLGRRISVLERAILDLAQYVTDTPHPRHELKSEAIDKLRSEHEEVKRGE